MATNNDVIRDALGLLGVLQAVEPVAAEDAALGLRCLNDLLAEWEADGIAIGYYPQTEVNDDVPVDADAVQVLKHMLAVAMAPHFGKEPSPIVASFAGKGYARLLRDAMVASLEESTLDHLPGGSGIYNIVTDT